MAIIYKITNIVNNKIYIGCTIKSIDKRFSEHISRSKKENNIKLYNSIRKYGEENFIIEKIIDCEECEMFDLEMKYISEFNSFELGLNSSIGGEGCLGYKHTKESLEKISGENSYSIKFRKDKNYSEIYGEDRSKEESKKRSDGVKTAWKNSTEEEKLARRKATQDTKLKKAGYTKELILEIKELHRNGMKPRFILEKYPTLTIKDINKITSKDR